MPAETLYPTSNTFTSNLNNSGFALVDEDIDDGSPSTDFADWDGNGNVTVRYGFDTPTGQLSIPGNLQQFRVLLRRAGTGSNTSVFSIRVFEAGSDTGASIQYNIPATTTGFNEYTFNWNAQILTAQSGVNVEIEIDQTAGGSGNPNRRSGIDIAAINWEVTYDVPPGGAPEPNVVWV